MDLTNTNKKTHQICRSPQPRSMSVDDDDNISQNSLSSCNLLHATVSDTESSSPVSVRDMIKRYDTAAKLGNKLSTSRRQQLPNMKSSYFGVNKFGSQTNVRQYVTQFQEDSDKSSPSNQKKANINHCNNNDHKDGYKSAALRKKDMESCGLNRGRRGSLCDGDNVYIADHTRRTSRSPMRDMDSVNGSLRAVASRDRANLLVNESVESPMHLHPIESSYQSKTTIAKTASGVRIIIDIFFDQEQQPMSATDVVGSRVETDIPQSRILSEFQQQAAAAQLARN